MGILARMAARLSLARDTPWWMLAAAATGAFASIQMTPAQLSRRVRVGFLMMKRRRRAAQLLSKMLNTQRDKCDAGEKKENKAGGGGYHTSGFFSSAIVSVCAEQYDSSRSVCHPLFLENESDD